MVRQSKTWCFTINNPTVDDRQNLVTLSTSQHFSYLVFGNEIGDSGTPHIQGFVIFNVRKRFQTAKDLIGGRAHLEAARGTDYQAAEYCKKDGDFAEFGDSPVNVPRHTGTTGQFADYTSWVTSFFELHDDPPQSARSLYSTRLSSSATVPHCWISPYTFVLRPSSKKEDLEDGKENLKAISWTPPTIGP